MKLAILNTTHSYFLQDDNLVLFLTFSVAGVDSLLIFRILLSRSFAGIFQANYRCFMLISGCVFAWSFSSSYEHSFSKVTFVPIASCSMSHALCIRSTQLQNNFFCSRIFIIIPDCYK
ncbi:unnamed protein product [Albugo candida]|uniref:Uncharacterized protein n=1 Tax=Albugo candida TaxID=65357 RepID=A0A024G7Z0_9STRA|nr:unnamed protein product [Albugo candida]|eukprot:CCI42976.1 unnamed protein product [Albugo candida]